jgi:hypothetical protein
MNDIYLNLFRNLFLHSEKIMAQLDVSREDDVIVYTQQKREMVVDHLMKTGVPEDTAQLSLLLGALSDMDRTALGSKRLRVDDKAVSTAQQAAHLIGEVLQRIPLARPYEAEIPIDREIPVLPDHLTDIKLVEGEVSQIQSNETHDEFIKRMMPQ